MHLPRRADASVRIAGGGPAGLSCAIALAREGVPVDVFEMRKAVGARFHGGHQILPEFGCRPYAWELLEGLGLRASELDIEPLQQATFTAHGGRSVSGTSRRPYAWLIRRGADDRTLDSALYRHAQELGVRVHTGVRVDAEQVDVVATGPSGADGVALEMLFTTSAHDRVDVLLDSTLTPGGYAYLFVDGGRGTMGVAALAGYDQMEAMLHQVLAQMGRRDPLEIRDPRFAKAAMNFALPRSAMDGGRMLVGEAAGFSDFLYGLGIQAAVRSGQLAARALLTGDDYDAMWHTALRSRQRCSLVDRYLYEALPAGSERLLSVAGKQDLQLALDRFQRWDPLKRALLPWVLWRWARRDGRCHHGPRDHWCRARKAWSGDLETAQTTAADARSLQREAPFRGPYHGDGT